MILITRACSEGEEQIVALFGVGLIGSAVFHAILHAGVLRAEKASFNWNAPDALRADSVVLMRRIRSRTTMAKVRRVEVIWTAGRAGFTANARELESEMAAFECVTMLCEQLAIELPRADHRFHIMSSAGGLFEGQRFVTRDSIPSPFRPYGRLKMNQELRAMQLSDKIIPYIYRPSSVYGMGKPGARTGLIISLIQNAAKYRNSHIYGRLDTLRDYVLANDIGRFVARCLDRGAASPAVFILASGKPTSVFEVIRIVGRVVGHPLYLRVDPGPSNARHISFRKSTFPEGWLPTDLETGIRQVIHQMNLPRAVTSSSERT